MIFSQPIPNRNVTRLRPVLTTYALLLLTDPGHVFDIIIIIICYGPVLRYDMLLNSINT